MICPKPFNLPKFNPGSKPFPCHHQTPASAAFHAQNKRVPLRPDVIILQQLSPWERSNPPGDCERSISRKTWGSATQKKKHVYNCEQICANYSFAGGFSLEEPFLDDANDVHTWSSSPNPPVPLDHTVPKLPGLRAANGKLLEGGHWSHGRAI